MTAATYILVVILQFPTGPVQKTTEFPTLDQCKIAQEGASVQAARQAVPISSMCLIKQP